MIYNSTFNGLHVSTGDVLLTCDGEETSLFGQIWQLLGKVMPGEVDHCVLYLGPGGRCIESAARGVLQFEMPGEAWESAPLFPQRWLLDTFYGVAYPLANRGISEPEEERIRISVARYCLEQAALSKPYNLNFFNPETDGAFYCSQLIYKAYLAEGIDLNINRGVPAGVFRSIVFPQEIWDACSHRRPGDDALKESRNP
jgi:hypothetical protein